MSATRSISTFEALPPEIFNQILCYIFDPAQYLARESTTAFRCYRFDTAMLRVSKSIHDLAKSYLHYSLSWIRFEINWDAFLIDPHWLGVPYITIDRTDPPKVLPHVSVGSLPHASHAYGGDLARRSPKQQAPQGRVMARIKFPPPISDEQKQIRARCFNSPFGSFMSVLVLEDDVESFLMALRMNDLAYCRRILPGADVSTEALNARRDGGMNFDIRVSPGQELKRYRHLVDNFKSLNGPFHNMTITGSEDKAHVVAVVETAELRMSDSDRRKQILDSKKRVYIEAIKLLMFLKHRGDKYLLNSLYANAFMCYDYAAVLEHYWCMHDHQPDTEDFWVEDNDVYQAFGASLACNMAIAHTAGGFSISNLGFRGKTIISHGLDMAIMTATGTLLERDRYLELLFTVVACQVTTRYTPQGLENKQVRDGLEILIRMITQVWEVRHDPVCSHEGATAIGKVYIHARAILEMLASEPTEGETSDMEAWSEDRIQQAKEEKSARARKLMKKLYYMANNFKDVNRHALKFAIHEDLILKGLREPIKFLPRIRLTNTQRIATTQAGWKLAFPSFSDVTIEALMTGEKGTRYLI